MSTSTTPPAALVVTAENDRGERAIHQLETGRSVLVGRSKDCGLRLQGEELSACHCLLSFENGTLWVQDWASQSGTLLNGQPVEAKVAVGPSDELRVGEYRLTTAAATTGIATAWLRGGDQHAESEPNNALPSRRPAKVESGGEQDATWDQDAEAEAGDATASAEAAPLWGDDELLGDFGDRERGRTRGALEPASFEQETIALLREEIELLQEMLAERDAQLAQRDAQLAQHDAAFDESAAGIAIAEEDDETEALLARMEQLLEEAAHGDERVALLEEMLRAAEEANQAEQEERHQLEAWVGDIERRIAHRDEQRDAEVEALRARLEEATEERERAQLQLQQAAAVGNAPQHYEQTLARLQQQNKALQERIAQLISERAGLAQQLEQSGCRDEEALREERVALAQERAIVSRLRSELANKLSALEESPKPLKPAESDAATRLQALREHLREIHNEEQQASPKPRNHGLSGRLSRIWKRLEN
ncbi:FHA domain-containing protein [Candidatus Laterigemmans baculatus]|uniref:FHA domain-containing protein n=1 Tax=Candidatus Laterigemmans baculatus TaxID=2770505 RepID=UPI0013D967A1|nr:FHA domain-containing protein [Candidatus Laterigemmans baculatus]